MRLISTAAELDPLLGADWAGLEECLELLDQAHRSGGEKAGSGEQGAKRGELSYPCSKLRVPCFEPAPAKWVPFSSASWAVAVWASFTLLTIRGSVAKWHSRYHDSRALLDDDLRRRFLRKAEAAARLSHPNLVPVYEVGEDNSICYLASEYCPGLTLAQWLRATKRRNAGR